MIIYFICRRNAPGMTRCIIYGSTDSLAPLGINCTGNIHPIQLRWHRKVSTIPNVYYNCIINILFQYWLYMNILIILSLGEIVSSSWALDLFKTLSQLKQSIDFCFTIWHRSPENNQSPKARQSSSLWYACTRIMFQIWKSRFVVN